LGYSRLGTNIVSYFMPGREMIGRERNRIEPLFRDLLLEVNKNYGTNYKYEDFKIKITDDKVLNAFALGYKHITIGSQCLDSLTDLQLKSVLAHELAHLYYKDSVHNASMIFSSYVTLVIMYAYGSIVAIQTIVKTVTGQTGTLVTVASYLGLLILLPVIVLKWVSNKVYLYLSMLMNRTVEYRADAFVVNVGLKDPFIEVLEIMDNQSIVDDSFYGRLIATHPAPKLRIGALEDDLKQKNILGSLLISTPDNKLNIVDNGFQKLLLILLGVGFIWCGYQVFDYYHTLAKPKINFVYR
ncbi:MAG: M48 family metalloprotease, partial [Microcystis sp. M122S2]|uniref:M48 family metalloprotease n=1 Tax=Microcystis sp. M122S2 TaxID=2771142 RepID=UPI0025857117